MTKRPLSAAPPKPRSAYARNRPSPRPAPESRRIVPLTPAGEVRRQRAAAALWVSTRDRMHAGVMREGACTVCYGWVDDPRHMGSNLQVWPY
jgi:hypothetical protein